MCDTTGCRSNAFLTPIYIILTALINLQLSFTCSVDVLLVAKYVYVCCKCKSSFASLV